MKMSQTLLMIGIKDNLDQTKCKDQFVIEKTGDRRQPTVWIIDEDHQLYIEIPHQQYIEIYHQLYTEIRPKLQQI